MTVLERAAPNFTRMEEVLRSCDSSERRHLTCAKGLREFESLTVNRTHGLADGEDSETRNLGVSQVLSVPDLRPLTGGTWGAGGLGRHSIEREAGQGHLHLLFHRVLLNPMSHEPISRRARSRRGYLRALGRR